jgi:chromatin remodeling complex protein RSC6
MVRASKTSEKVSNTTTATVAPAAASVPAKVASKKAAKTETVAVAPVVPVTPSTAVTEQVEVVPDVSTLPVKMNEFNAKLQQLISLFSTVKNDFKTLEKAVTREMKNAQKLSSKKRRNNGNRKPSGFIKPTRISDELAAFLGKNIGTEMARTEVSKEINCYIQTHGLQDKSNGRKINPDAKLTQLLKINNEDELTYFNLQRFMKHHFIKPDVVDTSVAAVSV